MSNPLHDLERRVDALAARLDLSDARVKADVDAIKDDIAQIREWGKGFVTIARFTPLERLFWTSIAALVVGLIGAVVAIVTRSPS
jgi:hypothetical protein